MTIKDVGQIAWYFFVLPALLGVVWYVLVYRLPLAGWALVLGYGALYLLFLKLDEGEKRSREILRELQAIRARLDRETLRASDEK